MSTPQTFADAPSIDLLEALKSIPAAAFLHQSAFDELAHRISSELERRVGTKLAEGLTKGQLDEFETLVDYKEAHPDIAPNGNGPATAWLQTHRPNYRHTVQTVFDELIAQTRTLLEAGRAEPHEKPGYAAPDRGAGESLPEQTSEIG
jgi:Protein of unknown function (DUF5663)